MSDEPPIDGQDKMGPAPATPAETPVAGEAVPTRRRMLMLGAVTAGAVVSIRPALAQTVASVMTCEIPVPDIGRAGQYIDINGTVVPPGTKGAFPPPGRPFKGEDVKRALKGAQLPGTTYESNRAYISYIRRLQHGQSGFTCFASLQMPRA